MGKRKQFPKVDLAVPGVAHARDDLGRVVVHLDVIPPADTFIHFPIEGNATQARSFDFARWYGVRIDEIAYACQRQIERFISTHDGDRTVATVVAYCHQGLRIFFEYLLRRAEAERRDLGLIDIDRDLIDGYLVFLSDGQTATVSQKKYYQTVKAVLVALGQRGLVNVIRHGDANAWTFPANPFPNANRKYKGQRPLPKAQRREFTQAVKTAVMPLLNEDVAPTSELLAYALLVVSLHTGRNTTPLLELTTDCLRSHPKEAIQFLVVFKRRGNRASKVPVRDSKSVESTPTVLPTVVRLIRRVIELTAPFRAEAPEHLKDRLWLFRSRVGHVPGAPSTGPILALGDATLGVGVTKLVELFGLKDANGDPLRITVSRLRKTFANRIYEILDGDLATTAIALGNTPQVAGNSYMTPGENAQRNWKFMGHALTTELLKGTVGETEKTPTGRCSDTRHGQFAPKTGATCMSFLDCLRCRNYVVTGDDLYRLFSFYWLVIRERSRVDKKKWQRLYGHIVRMIDRDVITEGVRRKVFKQSEVDAARDRARSQPHPYWATANVLEAMQR